jgi:hypothetical protein
MTTYKVSLHIRPDYLGQIREHATADGRLGLGATTLSTRYFEELLTNTNPNAKRIGVERKGDVLEVSCRKRAFKPMGGLNVEPLLKYADPIQ